MELEKKIESEKKRLQGIVDTLYDDKNNTDKALTEIHNEMAKKAKPHYDKIKDIEKSFSSKIENANKLNENMGNKKWRAEYNLRNVRIAVKGRHAVKTGVFEDGEFFKGFLHINNVHVKNVDKIKKTLPNGIELYRSYDDYSASKAGAVSYFAVYKGKIVGFHFTKKAEHAGDYADPIGWMSVKKLWRENGILIKEKSTYSDKVYDNPVNFTQWKEMISMVDVSKLHSIDLKDEENQQALSESWNITLPSKKVKK